MAEVKPTHLTKEGLKHYQEKIAYLKGEKTLEIIKRIEIARGFGDLSENSEYDDAKREQQENEAEKHRIEEILKNAQFGYVGSCGYGAKLTLEMEDGEKMVVFKGCDSCEDCPADS